MKKLPSTSQKARMKSVLLGLELRKRLGGGLTFPTLAPDHPDPALETIAIDGVRREDHVQQAIIEEGLKRRDRPALYLQCRGEAARSGIQQRQDLTVDIILAPSPQD